MGLCVFGGSQLRCFCLSPHRVCGDAAEAPQCELWLALWELLPAAEQLLVLPARSPGPSAHARGWHGHLTGTAVGVYRTPGSPLCRHEEEAQQPSERGLRTSEQKCQIDYSEMLWTSKWSPSRGQLENVSLTI